MGENIIILLWELKLNDLETLLAPRNLLLLMESKVKIGISKNWKKNT